MNAHAARAAKTPSSTRALRHRKNVEHPTVAQLKRSAMRSLPSRRSQTIAALRHWAGIHRLPPRCTARTARVSSLPGTARTCTSSNSHSEIKHHPPRSFGGTGPRSPLTQPVYRARTNRLGSPVSQTPSTPFQSHPSRVSTVSHAARLAPRPHRAGFPAQPTCRPFCSYRTSLTSRHSSKESTTASMSRSGRSGPNPVGCVRPDLLGTSHDDRPTLACLAAPPSESDFSPRTPDHSATAVCNDGRGHTRHQIARLRLRNLLDTRLSLMAVTLRLERPSPGPDTFTRADLEFRGVDHSGPSYEARIFLDEPQRRRRNPQRHQRRIRRLLLGFRPRRLLRRTGPLRHPKRRPRPLRQTTAPPPHTTLQNRHHHRRTQTHLANLRRQHDLRHDRPRRARDSILTRQLDQQPLQIQTSAGSPSPMSHPRPMSPHLKRGISHAPPPRPSTCASPPLTARGRPIDTASRSRHKPPVRGYRQMERCR